jgi:hypothetical protein
VEENKFSRLQWRVCDSLVSCCCVVDVLLVQPRGIFIEIVFVQECGLLVERNERGWGGNE